MSKSAENMITLAVIAILIWSFLFWNHQDKKNYYIRDNGYTEVERTQPQTQPPVNVKLDVDVDCNTCPPPKTIPKKRQQKKYTSPKKEIVVVAPIPKVDTVINKTVYIEKIEYICAKPEAPKVEVPEEAPKEVIREVIVERPVYITREQRRSMINVSVAYNPQRQQQRYPQPNRYQPPRRQYQQPQQTRTMPPGIGPSNPGSNPGVPSNPRSMPPGINRRQ